MKKKKKINTEVQNTIADKTKALTNNEVLEPDRITKLNKRENRIKIKINRN